MGGATVLLLECPGAGVAEDFLKGDGLSLWADIMVVLLVVYKSIRPAFIGAVRWDETL